MDLGLFQREVAERLGVSPDTVKNWEAGRTEPALRYVSPILYFLGDLTLPETESALDFPARLTLARRLLGLTQAQVADRIGVNESTVWEWENENHSPARRHRERIENLLGPLHSAMETNQEDRIPRAPVSKS